MAKLFGRLNNLSYRGGETETANVVIDGGAIKVDVVGSPQDVTGAYIINSTLYITRASASPLEIALPLPQPDLAETNTESLAFVKNKKISYLENDKDYITTKGADKTYIKKVTVNNADVPILDNDSEQVAQLLVGEGLSVGSNATVSVDTSKIATNEYVDSNIEVVTDDITQHKNDYNNPHNVTKAQVGLDKADNTADIDKPISKATKTALDTLQGEIEAHIEDGNNPHQVTAEQVGLGNVDNTSDIDKPVSTLQQQALDTKVDKVEGKGLSTEDFTTELKSKLDSIEAGAQVNTITGVKGDAESEYRVGNVNITKGNIGLENVDNTSDENKPISTAQQEALDGKVDKTSVSIAADANTIAKRHADGKLYVGTPTENYDAATKKYVDEQVATKTSVTVNGEHINEFDADTKQNVITSNNNLLDMGLYGYNGRNYIVSTNGIIELFGGADGGIEVTYGDSDSLLKVTSSSMTYKDVLTVHEGEDGFIKADVGYGDIFLNVTGNEAQIKGGSAYNFKLGENINITTDTETSNQLLISYNSKLILGDNMYLYCSNTKIIYTDGENPADGPLCLQSSSIKLLASGISLIASDGKVVVVGQDEETPYLTIGPGNQVFVDTPTVAQQVANKEYVDTKQDKLSTTVPIEITEDNNIRLNYDNVTLSVNDAGKLVVYASNLAGWGLYESDNKLNVDLDTIFRDLLYDEDGNPKSTGLTYESTTETLRVSNGYGLNVNSCNILYVDVDTLGSDLAGTGLNYNNYKLHVAYGDGLQYNSTTQKLEVNFYTVAEEIAGRGLSYNATNGKIESDTYTTDAYTYGTFTFTPGILTTIRAKIGTDGADGDASRIHFNNEYWIELTYCDNYAWGMRSSSVSDTYFTYSALKVDSTTCEIIGTDGVSSSNHTAFITETIVR